MNTAFTLAPSTYALPKPFSPLAAPVPAGLAEERVALIDAGQCEGLRPRLQTQFGLQRTIDLYEGTRADNALALSPLVVKLPNTQDAFEADVAALDTQCHHLPILAIVQITCPVAQWVAHLRSLLFLKMDETPYLWRLADTQALRATVAVLTPAQRAALLRSCRQWAFATEDGELQRLVPSEGDGTASGCAGPFALNADQTNALMSSAAASVLAGQLRGMAQGFGQQLSHAQQMRFARHCLEEARLDCVDEDSELLVYALGRWQALSGQWHEAHAQSRPSA